MVKDFCIYISFDVYHHILGLGWLVCLCLVFFYIYIAIHRLFGLAGLFFVRLFLQRKGPLFLQACIIIIMRFCFVLVFAFFIFIVGVLVERHFWRGFGWFFCHYFSSYFVRNPLIMSAEKHCITCIISLHGAVEEGISSFIGIFSYIYIFLFLQVCYFFRPKPSPLLLLWSLEWASAIDVCDY